MPTPRGTTTGGHWVATVTIARGDDAEVVAARLWQAGATGLHDRGPELDAWFTQHPDQVGPTVAALSPGGVRWRFEPTTDHLAAWRASLEVITVGGLDLVPTHLADTHAPVQGRHRIVLDPGQAFGSGHHATTAGCLAALAEVGVAGATVLDVGTGTGILAIAAARQGARRVVAVDVDPVAVAVARRNAATNQVSLDLRVGSLDAVDDPAQVVLANLLTTTLVELADDLFAATRPGGVLIASGVGSERAQVVDDALVAAGFEHVTVTDHGEWVVLTGSSPTG